MYPLLIDVNKKPTMGQSFPVDPKRIPSDGVHPIHPCCGDLEVKGQSSGVHVQFRADKMTVRSLNATEVCVIVRVVGSDGYYLMQQIVRQTGRMQFSLCKAEGGKVGEVLEKGVMVNNLQFNDQQPIGLVKFERVPYDNVNVKKDNKR